jgi:hypothetical protein
MYEISITPWERWFSRETPGLQEVTQQAWPFLRRGETGLDLTHALDSCRQDGTCWYYFAYHASGTANKVIGTEIARWIDRGEVM